ncbi:MAG: NAD(P)H-dependent oxidoreductase subunit E [Firmicutes bacterium]|nr:NAD(P)H-dependent oxidoreductase subunit E [Bacillota bacterium]
MERLTSESIKKINEIVEAHKDLRGPVMVMLHEVQDAFGYIPFEAIEKISEASGESVAEVFGVVNFYAQFTTEPKGKHVINVCLGTACYVKGSQTLIDEASEITGAPINGTSEDGLFSIDATRCVGACGLAPVCIIDGRVIGASTKEIIREEVKAIIDAEMSQKGKLS